MDNASGTFSPGDSAGRAWVAREENCAGAAARRGTQIVPTRSLVAQRFDRVQLRGGPSRINAKYDADADRNPKR